MTWGVIIWFTFLIVWFEAWAETERKRHKEDILRELRKRASEPAGERK